MGPSVASGRAPPPDVAVVGGIAQVPADVLKHFPGRGTVPGVEDLHTAPWGRGTQKLSHEGPRVYAEPPPWNTTRRSAV